MPEAKQTNASRRTDFSESYPAPPAEQQTEVELPRATPAETPQPVSQISSLRGLPHSSSLSTATVPRFGVQTDQEGQLAKVGFQWEC